MVESTTDVAVTNWVFDPDHSTFEFAARHILVSTIKGVFTDVSGEIFFNPQAVEESWVRAEVKIASQSTHIPKRDQSLLGESYFDVENFPTATFVSTRVVPTAPDRFEVYGDLTLRGVTNEVVFDTTYEGTAVHPSGQVRGAFTALTTIKRLDFGFPHGREIPAGGPSVRNEVALALYTSCYPKVDE
jgi:polyisoprenoid-binding protein YceI